jgi:amino acid permease
MNKKLLWVILFIVIFTITVVAVVNTNYKNAKDIKENYIQINAIIENIYRSGTGIKLSTLLIVKYNYNGVEKAITIRRNGYKENYYNKGDTIIININKENNMVK